MSPRAAEPGLGRGRQRGDVGAENAGPRPAALLLFLLLVLCASGLGQGLSHASFPAGGSDLNEPEEEPVPGGPLPGCSACVSAGSREAGSVRPGLGPPPPPALGTWPAV